jgi:hypothetical protein
MMLVDREEEKRKKSTGRNLLQPRRAVFHKKLHTTAHMDPHPIYLLDSTSESDLDSDDDSLGERVYGPPPGYGYYDMDTDDSDLFSDSDSDGEGFFHGDPFGFLPRLMYVFQQQHFHRQHERQRPHRYVPAPNGRRPEYNIHYSPNSVAKCQKCKKSILEGTRALYSFSSLTAFSSSTRRLQMMHHNRMNSDSPLLAPKKAS